MKKIIVILILGIIFACGIFANHQPFTLSNYFNSGTLHIYTKAPINETSVPLTSIYMSEPTPHIQNSDIIGESMYFENLEVGSAINTLKATVKFTEYIKQQNLTIIYAYTKLINQYKIINNTRVNLQISTCDEYSVIGWPLIYGSF